MRARTQGITFRGTVNQRIDQGLIQLERLVQEIRDAVMIRDSTSMISLDPELHEEIEAESRNIMSSKFFKAIMKQLRKESDTEDKEKEE